MRPGHVVVGAVGGAVQLAPAEEGAGGRGVGGAQDLVHVQTLRPEVTTQRLHSGSSSVKTPINFRLL